MYRPRGRPFSAAASVRQCAVPVRVSTISTMGSHQPGPTGQRQQPVPQLLIRERPRVVGQRDHLSQYRTCRAELLDGRGGAVKVGLRVDGSDCPVRAPGGID